jgi:hypothetical protein
MLVTARCASGYMLETPSISRYSSAHKLAVTMRRVRTISRKGPRASWESSETIRRTSEKTRMMRWSPLHGDMQELHPRKCNSLRNILSKTRSEIPCRVSSDLHEWRNDLGAVSSRDPVKL